MEAIAEHVLEPEVRFPAPRRLRLPRRTLGLLSVAALLLSVFIFGSGRALWEGAKLTWLDAAGHTTYGSIVAIQAEPAAKGQIAAQTAIRYAASVPTPTGVRLQTGWIILGGPTPLPGAENRPIKVKAPPVFHLGQPIPLRTAALLGFTVCQPWGPSPGSRILTLFLAGGLVLAVSLLLLRRLGLWAGDRLYLLRHGSATVGTITHTRSEAEDMVRYFLRYGYAGGTAGIRDREEQVSADQWREFHVGQPVTVLFDPEHPERAGLYALIVQK